MYLVLDSVYIIFKHIFYVTFNCKSGFSLTGPSLTAVLASVIWTQRLDDHLHLSTTLFHNILAGRLQSGLTLKPEHVFRNS